jgi:murein DD-endopeptidase MepM/ murein hydrolase activator NlpD
MRRGLRPLGGARWAGRLEFLCRFADRKGVTRSGIVTIAAVLAFACLSSGAAASRLAPGAQGKAVSALQLDLARHGFPSGALDGQFGPGVAGAVRRFQRSIGVVPNGIAGPATLAALRRPLRRSSIPLGWPLLAPVGDRFGVRGGRFHAGIDLIARGGTTVVAAAPGRVTWAARRAGGWGLLVVVRHQAGVRTMYAHLESTAVHVGDWVAGGTALGRVGATGDATGPHLHFEVRVKGAAVDPLTALVTLGN